MNWATLYAGQRDMELEGAPGTAWPQAGKAVPTRGRSVAIRLDGVAKSFGERAVLDDLSLTIEAGQFVAVVGRSGCGKTTLLRMIAGLEGVSTGQVTVDDQPVVGLRSDVRLLFQEPRLLPWHRVLSNVGIARGSGWQAHAQAALEDVGLGDRAQDWPAVLSGGQRQRVALARALVSRPKALLMDEPFGALDALTRSEMHQLLLRVRVEYGFTAILITHDVREALALADRILVLKEGGVARDIPIDVPLDLRRASPALQRLERTILTEV
ncbi:MAG TPA: ABC transporter ATP-binding protein [Dongiaceae bacterium]|nr:ABC transporter ATP-binding protein [Dongiaceae bacterium]